MDNEWIKELWKKIKQNITLNFTMKTWWHKRIDKWIWNFWVRKRKQKREDINYTKINKKKKLKTKCQQESWTKLCPWKKKKRKIKTVEKEGKK